MITKEKSTAPVTVTRSDAEERELRGLARRVLRLEDLLDQTRGELLRRLGLNERVVLDEGTFQAVNPGWHPDAAFVRWIGEHPKVAKAVTVMKPQVSMAKVNIAAGKFPTLQAYLDMARAGAAGRITLRFKPAVRDKVA